MNKVIILLTLSFLLTLSWSESIDSFAIPIIQPE